MAAATRLRVDQHRNAHAQRIHGRPSSRRASDTVHTTHEHAARAAALRLHVHGEPRAFDHGSCPKGHMMVLPTGRYSSPAAKAATDCRATKSFKYVLYLGDDVFKTLMGQCY
jgi:hypothetical protein